MGTYIVTGGSGFIGSNFILEERKRGTKIINLDLLTYAGNPMNLEALREDPLYIFAKGDIGDRALVGRLLREFRPDGILNFAAESHVDRSIAGPEVFIRTTFHFWGRTKLTD